MLVTKAFDKSIVSCHQEAEYAMIQKRQRSRRTYTVRGVDHSKLQCYLTLIINLTGTET